MENRLDHYGILTSFGDFQELNVLLKNMVTHSRTKTVAYLRLVKI